MLSGSPSKHLATELRLIDGVSLFNLCASDRENADAWSEFMRRYTGRFKYFVNGVLRQHSGRSQELCDISGCGGVQESDLLQNIIVRLVENDCAVMKKFSGKSEDDLLAYLAVISRSCVLDSFRRTRASKRRPATAEIRESFLASVGSSSSAHPEPDSRILAGELLTYARQTIHSHSGRVSGRDQLVFDLHFFDGLSCGQIARCKGVKLSKAGVEKLLRRVVGRIQSLASSGKSEETLQ